MSEDATPHRVVYAGKRILSNNKIGRAFVLESAALANVGNDEKLDRLLCLYAEQRDKGAPLIIGHVYLIKVVLDEAGERFKQAFISSRSWQEEAGPELADTIAVWRIRDAAANEESRTIAASKKLKSDSRAMREITHLRRLYHSLPVWNRHGFETGLMSLIRMKD